MDMNAPQPIPAMTTAEFLAWPGDGSGRKFQLVDGEVREMPPASATHGQIQMQIGMLLLVRRNETGGRMRVISEGAIVPAFQALKNVRIPDIVGTITRDARGQIAIPDPVLAIEILSPSNEGDTRLNVVAYRTIPSMREIVIVHSMRIKVEVHRRLADGEWPGTPELIGAGEGLRIEVADLDCPIEQVYQDTWLVER